MRGLIVLVSMLAALVTTNAAAADKTDHSANYFLPSCRDFVNGNFVRNPLLQGQCIGMIEALAAFANNQPFESSRSCPPEDATIGQLTRVIVRWIDEHPQRWHEDFLALALFALHEAWPCK
jgi:hypothetical protein